ncbi:hypothetical protein NXS15_03075 [Mycoplasma sp. CSL7475-4]|uniref:hypothetical protein n=1 Tax=Mycoplasma sp. CSL7475-4 TaxID=2973942 RepID=UPI00216B1D76|nr:hypothetical protein [Mycoplasma sp. CSL7475-4]MCS4537093.1 hypothetical protein [Mycoplasma sp. CSL7475-4]
MKKKLYLSLTPLAALNPFVFVAAACVKDNKTVSSDEKNNQNNANNGKTQNDSQNNSVDNNSANVDTKNENSVTFKLNDLGRTMNSVEIKNRFDKMITNNSTKAELAEYINLFLIDKLPQSLSTINVNTSNDDLVVNYTENGVEKSINLSGFERYDAKNSENGKKEFGRVKIGDISISTNVASGAEKIGAIEFQELWKNEFDRVQGDGAKMLDWAIENKYLDVDGDYKNSEWIYTLHRNSHHHGDTNFHTYISAEDKLTGRIYRDFDHNGQPGFTLFGWNSIAKLGNIHIHKLIYVNDAGNRATTKQINDELDAASTISAKLDVIAKYTDEEFSEFKTGNNDNVDYKIDIVSSPENDLNQLRISIAFKGKAATQYEKENSALIVLNRINTKVQVGAYTFNTSGYNGNYYANDLLSWLKPGNEDGHHFKPLDSFKDAYVFENITSEEQFENKLELMNSDEFDESQYPYGAEALLLLIDGFTDKDYNIISEKHDKDTKDFVNSLVNRYDSATKKRIVGKIYQDYQEAKNAATGNLEQKRQALHLLHSKLSEYANRIGKIVIDDRIRAIKQRIEKYDAEQVPHTILDALLKQAEEMLNVNKTLSDRLELADRIDQELEYFQFGDTTQMSFSDLVDTLRNRLGFNIEESAADGDYTYKLDQNSFIVKDHSYSRDNEKIEDYSTLTLTILVNNRLEQVPVTFNLLFKHSNEN